MLARRGFMYTAGFSVGRLTLAVRPNGGAGICLNQRERTALSKVISPFAIGEALSLLSRIVGLTPFVERTFDQVAVPNVLPTERMPRQDSASARRMRVELRSFVKCERRYRFFCVCMDQTSTRVRRGADGVTTR